MLNQGDKFGKYTIVKRIGVDEQGNSKGANATVFVVSYKDKQYVLKIPNNPERLENLFREIGNWAKVNSHPNILTYHETVTASEKIGFISEYIQSGSLNDWLRNSTNLTILQKLSMIDGILSGLEHLHENLILHRDLKPENIFVKEDVPLLADFGSAKDYDFAELQYAYGFTYRYAPPELVALYDDFGASAKYQITEFDDLWSVAIIICEILTGQYPFARMSKIMEGELRPFPQNADKNIIGFIQKSLQKERKNRFQSVKEMREALRNPQQFIVEKVEDSETIIDEDFDKTEQLVIEPIKDWREVKTEKVGKLIEVPEPEIIPTVEQTIPFVESRTTPVEQITHQANESKSPIENLRLIPYRKGDKWGFCDSNKRIVIPLKYGYAFPFSEGLAMVELNYGKYGFINESGEEVIPIKYDGYSLHISEFWENKFCSAFNEGLATVRLNTSKQ